MLYRLHLAMNGIRVLIDADCIGSYKSNYHTIMTTMTPLFKSLLSNDRLYLSSTKRKMFQKEISILRNNLFFLFYRENTTFIVSMTMTMDNG
jgi:hypothetical protein